MHSVPTCAAGECWAVEMDDVTEEGGAWPVSWSPATGARRGARPANRQCGAEDNDPMDNDAALISATPSHRLAQQTFQAGGCSLYSDTAASLLRAPPSGRRWAPEGVACFSDVVPPSLRGGDTPHHQPDSRRTAWTAASLLPSCKRREVQIIDEDEDPSYEQVRLHRRVQAGEAPPPALSSRRTQDDDDPAVVVPVLLASLDPRLGAGGGGAATRGGGGKGCGQGAAGGSAAAAASSQGPARSAAVLDGTVITALDAPTAAEAVAAVTTRRRDERQRRRPQQEDASAVTLSALENNVLSYLTSRPGAPVKTSRVIRDTGNVKLAVNQTLYALLKKGLVKQTPGSPPEWMAAEEEKTGSGWAPQTAAAQEPYVLVIIDLGCSHDVLANVIPYAEQGEMEVRAYADLAFNGFGLNPKVECKNFSLFHAKTADKNSADVALIWDVSRFVQRMSLEEPSREVQIYVCTRDLQFQSLKALVEENPLHTLTFCINWETLRCHVEG